MFCNASVASVKAKVQTVQSANASNICSTTTGIEERNSFTVSVRENIDLGVAEKPVFIAAGYLSSLCGAERTGSVAGERSS